MSTTTKRERAKRDRAHRSSEEPSFEGFLSCQSSPNMVAHSSGCIIAREMIGMQIRAAQLNDAPSIWQIIGPTIRAGETYALDRDMSEADALAYWMGNDRETFVAEEDGVIVGTYYIKVNQAGGGNHVCNCGYMTNPASVGRGVARSMCQHSLDHACRRRFRGMQFNFVVSTNTRAVALWQWFGFEIVGRLPQAFNHPRLGYVDALVMFRSLIGV